MVRMIVGMLVSLAAVLVTGCTPVAVESAPAMPSSVAACEVEADGAVVAGATPCQADSVLYVSEAAAETMGVELDAAGTYGRCQSEDADGCWWDAATQGNGAGRSFLATDAGAVAAL